MPDCVPLPHDTIETPSRREMLRATALGLGGSAVHGAISAADRVSSTHEQTGFGRAKRCLLLYIYGAWSQLDTFDPNRVDGKRTR